MAMSVLAIASAPTSAGAASLALDEFQSIGSLTAAPNGRVWFFAKTFEDRGKSLYAARASGTVRRVSLPGFKAGAARAGTIGVGGDGRLWVTATGIASKGRTSIFRISARGKVTAFVLPAKRRVIALAGDNAGRTWFLGYSGTRVGYLDRQHAIHSVPVANARSLEDVALGPDGRIWASARSSVTRISAHGKAVSFATQPLPSANIASGGGYLWLPGFGSVQRVSTAGSIQSIPLQFPTFDPQSITHVAYPFSPNRMSYSVFKQPGVAVGFTSGTSTLDNTIGLGTDFMSTGTVDSNGVAHESEPSRIGPDWYPSLTTGEYDSRRSGSKLATVDGKGNLWLAIQRGVVVLPPLAV